MTAQLLWAPSRAPSRADHWGCLQLSSQSVLEVRAAVLSDGFSTCRVLLITAISKLILCCIFLSLLCQLNKTFQHSKREQTEFIQTLPLNQVSSSLRIKYFGQSISPAAIFCMMSFSLMIPLVWPTSGFRAVQLTGEWEKAGQESEAQSSLLA